MVRSLVSSFGVYFPRQQQLVGAFIAPLQLPLYSSRAEMAFLFRGWTRDDLLGGSSLLKSSGWSLLLPSGFSSVPILVYRAGGREHMHQCGVANLVGYRLSPSMTVRGT